ncbi:MAX dimerization protein MGA a isoform X3 [Scleropages formosus]|uniref:MAX dimerization protein MGA a isoform X3 n=1 Tax=Scleropages formosus TaxID=113540 RepID=UPI0010FA7D16|nr:MAX gene-associated protein isoform X3 [Scleropages formosus]
MAATENQALMVLKEEGATAPAAVPSTATPLAFFVILKPGHASEGGQDQGILVTNHEANLATASSQSAPVVGLPPYIPSHSLVSCTTRSDEQPENLPPESTCKGVKVTLDNNNMWNEFYRCKTEMILTKQGRRMFPYCRFRISGMEPFQRYILVMDIAPMDNHRYKWTGRQWEPNGKAEPHVLGRVFIHPESPSLGHYWMQNPVSFYKLKVTNNTLDQEGHVILHSMHRYLPRLHVVPADKATEVIQLNGPDVMTFTFPQTEFFAVTAYQNLRITQLKIDYNPFAKGFREDGPVGKAKLDLSDPSLELSGSTVGSEEKFLKKSQESPVENSGDIDSYVIDKELVQMKDYGNGFLGNGISAVKAIPTDLRSKKRSWPFTSSDAVQESKSKVRRSLPEKSSRSVTTEQTELDNITKEEQQGLEFATDYIFQHPPMNICAMVPDKATGTVSVSSDPSKENRLASKENSQEHSISDSLLQPGELATKQARAIPWPQIAQFLREQKYKPRPIKPKPVDSSFSLPAAATSPSSFTSPPVTPDSKSLIISTKTSLPLSKGSENRGNNEKSFSQVTLEAPPTQSSCRPLSTAQAAMQQSSLGKKKRKYTPRSRKHGKLMKKSETDVPVVVGGPTDVSMQPNLEDVEGLLFVSFTSKEALEIHLGDQPLNRESLPQPQEEKVPETMQEKIARLELVLLQDLKRIKYRQVIHPVLQEVGLKLNLLDPTLAIDLQYLGVSLPLPSPSLCLGDDGNSGVFTLSGDGAVPFISRTGKTTDFTKIKGWRDKFNISTDASSSKSEGVGAPDGALKNRSAFCSDMLDEYLANEGKLIDERAASFSQSAVSPVVYQLPTKSTSYVRTLDSVLKKQAYGPVLPKLPLKPISPPKKPRVSSKPKASQKTKQSTGRGKSKPAVAKRPTTETSPGISSHSVSASHSTKLSAKTKMVPKTPQAPSQKLQEDVLIPEASLVNQLKCVSGTLPDKVHMCQDSTLISQGAAGRNPGISKMLVKLMELEDGAVWEGKGRTCITEERAAIALASLLTAQGSLKANKSTNRVIKRRAPPCLNDFCRLGCVCASLAQECRRFTHCGKPECMFGCTCLKRKVILIKTVPRKKKHDREDLIFYGALGNEPPSKLKKKKKKRMAYSISEPESESEPVAPVKTLWKFKEGEVDPEPLFAPTPVYFPLAQPMVRQDSTSFSQVQEEDKDPVYRYFESMMTCARVRPFSGKPLEQPTILSCKSVTKVKEEDLSDLNPMPDPSARNVEKKTEQSLQTPTNSEPSKRLEIMSECKWEKKSDRNQVLRVLCEHMAQNRLTHPFRVGSYLIKPISQTYEKEDLGICVTYKVCISQPLAADRNGEEAVEEHELQEEKNKVVREEGEEQAAVARRKVLPFFTHISPAGFLTANKKQPGVPAQGLIKVNGKFYPQAKLQLGQMGALHPANRLAAYITGRLSQTSQEVASDKLKLLKCPSSSDSGDSSSTCLDQSVDSSVMTNSTISSPSSAISTVLKHLVAKPTVGKVFTQFVVNKNSCLQQKLPLVSIPQLVGTVQKVALSSNPVLVVGPSLSYRNSQKFEATASTVTPPKKLPRDAGSVQVQELPSSNSSSALSTSYSISGTDENTLPKAAVLSSPGKTTSGPRMLLIPISQANPMVRPGAPSMSSLASGQRMVLQPVRSTSGATLYRHPNGQLVQLVPLSQLRAAQPNFVIRSPGTVVRLPTPSTVVSNPALSPTSAPSVSTVSVNEATACSTPSTPVLTKSPESSTSGSNASVRDSSPTSLQNSTVVTKSTTTTLATSPTSVASLSGATAFTVNSLSTSLKTLPGFLGQTGTYTLRISPGTKESKVITLNPAGSVPGSSEVLSVPSGFTLLQIPKSSVVTKPVVSQIVYTPAKGDVVKAPPKDNSSADASCHDTKASLTSKKIDSTQEVTAGGAVCSDHSYTSGREPLVDSKADVTVITCSHPTTPITSPIFSSLKHPSPVTSPLLKTPEVMIASGSPVLSHVASSEDSEAEPLLGNVITRPLWKAPETPRLGKKCHLEEGEIEGEGDLTVPGESDDLSDDSDDDSEDDTISGIAEPEESENESVDIETIEELSEKISIACMKAVAMQKKLEKVHLMDEAKRTAEQTPSCQGKQQESQKKQKEKTQEEVPNIAGRMHHNVTERRRRNELRELFEKLRQVLGHQHLAKASKCAILEEAKNEIQALVEQNDLLEEKKKLLNRQRATYIRKISQTSGKTEELIIRKLQDICTKQKMLEAQRRKKSSVSVTPKSVEVLASKPGATEDSLVKSSVPAGRPNILSRRKVPAPESTALPLVGLESLAAALNAVKSNQETIAMRGQLQPVTTVPQPEKSAGIRGGPSPVPGVASVTINVPGMSLPIQVKSPLPDVALSVSSQAPKALPVTTGTEARKNMKISNMLSVRSLVHNSQREEKVDCCGSENSTVTRCLEGDAERTSHEERDLEDGEVLGDQLTCDGQVEPTKHSGVKCVDGVSSQEEDDDDDDDDDGDDDDDTEDETLMSLLNEIVFLNQQLNSEDSPSKVTQAHFSYKPLKKAERLEVPGEGVSKSKKVEQARECSKDKEQSLKPLFVQKNEDLVMLKDVLVKDNFEAEGADLLRVVCGLGKKHEREAFDATVANGFGQQSLPSPAKGGALTPPPLLQMKAGKGALLIESKAGDADSCGKVSWRPMPRLAPLGLKPGGLPTDVAISRAKASKTPQNQNTDGMQKSSS